MKKKISPIYFSWILKILISLVFVLLVNHSIENNEFSLILAHVSPIHIIVALSLGVFGLYFQIKRWEIILRYQHFPITNNIALKTILWGNLLAFITPGRFGEIFRGLKITDSRKGDSLFAVIIDKLFIMLTILSVGLICTVLQVSVLKKGINNHILSGILVAFVLCGFGFFIILKHKFFDEKFKYSKYLHHLEANLPRLFTPAGIRTLQYSYAAHFCLICQTVLLLHMFHCGSFMVNLIAIGQAYGMMLFFPISIANMGVREGSYAFFLSHLGAQCENNLLSINGACLGTSILIMCINIIIPAMIGLIWYVYDSRYYGN